MLSDELREMLPLRGAHTHTGCDRPRQPVYNLPRLHEEVLPKAGGERLEYGASRGEAVIKRNYMERKDD